MPADKSTLSFDGDSVMESLWDAIHRFGAFREYQGMKYEGGVWRHMDAPDAGETSVSYSDLKATKHITPSTFFLPHLMTYSDYSGGTVERSNCDVFLEEHKENNENVLELTGGYGTRGVAIKLSAITEDMIETFRALSDYPVMDDEHHSQLEWELAEEAWDDWGHKDYRRALIVKFPQHEDAIEAITDERLTEIFRDVADRTGTYWNCESAVSAYIDLDSVVKATNESEVLS